MTLKKKLQKFQPFLSVLDPSLRRSQSIQPAESPLLVATPFRIVLADVPLFRATVVEPPSLEKNIFQE